MMRPALLRIAAATLATGTLAACATPGFRADVARFQQMPAPQGQTFAIRAGEGEDAGSLEFAHYASLVAEEMRRAGYQQAATDAAPSLIVKLSYGVDAGRERVVSEPGFGDPFWGRYGGYGGYGGWGRGGFYGGPAIIRTRHGYRYAYGLYDPFLFGPSWGDSDRVTSYTVYTSGIDLVIERGEGGQRLFEGSAEALSRSNDLTKLVPNLIAAMFTGFPGNSGEKVRITVAPTAQDARRR